MTFLRSDQGWGVPPDSMLPIDKAAPRIDLSVSRWDRTALAPVALILGDALALALAAGVGYAARRALNSYIPIVLNFESSAGVFVCLAAIPFGLWLANLYPGIGLPTVERLRRRTLVTFSVFLVMIAFDYIALHQTLSRGFIFTAFFSALVIPPLVDSAVRHYLRRARAYAEPVAVVGTGSNAVRLAEQLRASPETGYDPVAFIDSDPERNGTSIGGLPVIAPFSNGESLTARVRTAIVSIEHGARAWHDGGILDLPFVNTILLPSAFDLDQVWVSACEIGGSTGFRIRNNLLLPSNFLVKRALDVTLAALLLGLILPVMAATAAAIWCSSPGPILFRQIREGHDGKPITLFKFRTMCLDAEERLAIYLGGHPEAETEWKRHFKLRHDPRLLPWIGAFLRRYSIDELPQLWNVLRGDMSLIGPRPFPQYHLESFSEEFRALRRRVLPGITGLWQVTTRSDGDVAVQERLDSYYIRNWSLWLDIYILALTVRAVLMPEGAR
jgi:Undecaprenyl-phosphate galactose phosphotransferase WbaP